MRTYLLLISALVILQYSCQKPSDDPPGTGGQGGTGGQQGTAGDSISLLRGTGLGGFVYDNDTLPNKLYSFNTSQYGSWYKDTTFIYYTPDKKVSRFYMEAVATDYSGFHMRMPYFLVYSQGRVSKIYRKGNVQEPYDPNYYDPNYVLTLGPTTSPYMAALDSLVYDASGRLIANYHFTGGGASYVLNEYDILSYHSAGTPYAGLLYSVKLYDAANVLKDKIFFYEYDLTKRNPLYRAFKELALVRTVIHIRRFIPMEYYGNDFNRYVAMNPYVLTRLEARTVGYSGDVWYSYTLQNTFDAEGNLTNAAAACSGCNLGYSYIKKKK